MIFENDIQALEFVKEKSKRNDYFAKERTEKKELLSLLDGYGFLDELINKIAFVETENKIKARQKYARNIIDTVERIKQPINNVFHATGGSFEVNIKNEAQRKQFISTLANIRDNKSLKEYLESDWIQQLMFDPNGIQFIEYTTNDGIIKAYPTYKNIDSIRYYKTKGQTLEVVLFEPKPIENGGKLWRLVDDKTNYTFTEYGSDFTIVENATFEHYFGEVPGFINSNIISSTSNSRLSPFSKIIPILKDIAVTQSHKSIYKIQQAFPKSWEVGRKCNRCAGEGHTNGKKCNTCNGHGDLVNRDVTDLTVIPMPREGVIDGSKMAGVTSPDINYLEWVTEELTNLERLAYKSLWGVLQEQNKIVTATEKLIDQQPKTVRLNHFSDSAEWAHWKIADLIGNLITGNTTENHLSISYGRRFILEGVDTLIEKYSNSVDKGLNSVIMDRQLNELITAKYSNDPNNLRIQLIKSVGEPYIHQTLEQVNLYFGSTEAKKKVMFKVFWQQVDKDNINENNILAEYSKWFDTNVEIVNQ